MTPICALPVLMKRTSSELAGCAHYRNFLLNSISINSYCNEHDINSDECVQEMRSKVFEETKLTVSAGIAPNKVCLLSCLLELLQTFPPDACQGKEIHLRNHNSIHEHA